MMLAASIGAYGQTTTITLQERHLKVRLADCCEPRAEFEIGDIGALKRRPPINRDSGRAISTDRNDPISVTNASSGYPEIAPGSYVIISAPINRFANGWGRTTQIEGVSVEIGGQLAAIFQIWKDGLSCIVPDTLPIGHTLNVIVHTPEGRYHGKVSVLDVAPGVSRGSRNGAFQWWPTGLYRVGSGFPQPISDQAIRPSKGASKTIVKVLATGFRRAISAKVWIDNQTVPLVSVTPFFLPGQEEIAFELPEQLQGEERLVRVWIIADDLPANPFWLKLAKSQ